MKKTNIKERFSMSLLGIYNMDFTKQLIQFLQGEQAVLFALSVSGVLNPSDMSDKLGLTRSRMSMILTSLKKKELIDLQTDEKDRRRTNVELTKKGKQFITEKENDVLIYFDTYVDKMGYEKVEHLIKLINETVEHMKEVMI